MNRRAAGGLARAGAPTPAVAAGKRAAALIVLALTLHGVPAAAQPSPASAGPTPAAAQPSPAPAGPTPATAQSSPASAGPTPATAQPSPAAGTPAGPAAGPVPAAPQTTPLVVPPAASTAADFTVGDIKIEGLQRVSEGTVYNYLPVNIGDHLTPQRVREAIRALYATGFFRDVQMRRDGNTLIVVVLERPSIESFEITGNKDIKTEDLQKSLRGVGLAAGKTFDRSVLEDVTQYLTDQYFARGKYGVRIESKVEEEAGNRVKIKIDIKEGSRAKIREINIVGATRFKQKDILETLELKTPNWLSWYKQDDRYSRESLQGDLEKVRNYYMDRGYANFQLESTQVAIAPEKEDIFITVNIEEGQVYKVSQIKLAGTFVVPQSQLQLLLLIHPGDTFNRKLITATQELMQNRMGRDGYAFAKVDPVPTADNANHTVALTFFVDPGNRVYVRNISFSGTNRINDEVLRREMRQLEGGWLSNTSLERSKQRIQRLPYVKSVEFETTPVAGSTDLVDVNYKIEEGPASQLSGGIGYSETYKFMLNGSFADSDFLGSGQRIAVNLNGGAFSKVYTIQHTNPYTNVDNLQRTESITYSDVTQFVSSSSTFSSQTISLGPTWAYPISEFMYVRFGAAFNSSQLLTNSSTSALQAQQWVQENGHPYSRLAHDDSTNNEYVFYGTNFHTLEGIRRLGLGHPQPHAVRRPRHAHQPVLLDHYARQRREVLHRQRAVRQVRAAVARLHAVVPRGHRLRLATRAHHGDSTLPAVLRRRPGQRARLSREPPGSDGPVRQPLRRQHAHHQPERTALPHAGEICPDRAHQRLLRHGWGVPDRHEHQVLRTGRSDPELLQLQVRRPETLGRRRGAVAGAARPLPLQPGDAAERQVGRRYHHLGRPAGGVPVLGRQRVLRY